MESPEDDLADRPRNEGDEEREAESDEDDDRQNLQTLKEANIKALIDNSLQTCCKPLLSKFLTLKEGEQQLRRAFRSPHPGAPNRSQALKQRLLARKRFIPWGSNKPFLAPVPQPLPPPQPEADINPVEEELPDGIEKLVLWEPGEGEEGAAIVVDNMLTRFLRPHQREGVQFMFECVTGLRMKEGKGCILADDMGLGKTLQGITLLWTLLQSGSPSLGGMPLAKRVIIVCPTSLVSNWDIECSKWLKGKVRTLPLCESSRDDVISSVTQFLHPSTPYQVLIISYETFRLHAERFKGTSACDLLICDEAHRLKNDSTLTNRALDSLQCARRVLLSGTPMQNHLDEFYAMVDFCNPGMLGTPSEFRKHFEIPILAGREPGALEEEVKLGEERSAELSTIVNQFIMRRTNKLLSQHLPPKVVEVVCCRMTPLQQQLYCHFLESTAAGRLLNGAKATGVLSAITSLKKLCNHPKLIYDAVNSKHDEGALPEGFEGVGRLFPPGLFDAGRGGRSSMAVGWEETSGKMALLARMLHFLFTETDDRIVIVSNYTQTLDLVSQLCRERCYPFLRLDGSTGISKRQKLVKIFNDPTDKQFVFLLSSKAGGCGLNLIGANRLVLFDPDWNPANDKQAAARVWRDGQKKRVYVYRMLTTGTIEEKVFQRQMSKEGLQQVVSSKGGKTVANMMSAEELRDLFTLNTNSMSDTYDSIVRRQDGAEDAAAEEDEQEVPQTTVAEDGSIFRPQVGTPSEDDLKNWAFHSSPGTVPDSILQRSAGEDITFVFTLSVDGKQIDETPSGRVHCGASGSGRGMLLGSGTSSKLSRESTSTPASTYARPSGRASSLSQSLHRNPHSLPSPQPPPALTPSHGNILARVRASGGATTATTKPSGPSNHPPSNKPSGPSNHPPSNKLSGLSSHPPSHPSRDIRDSSNKPPPSASGGKLSGLSALPAMTKQINAALRHSAGMSASGKPSTAQTPASATHQNGTAMHKGPLQPIDVNAAPLQKIGGGVLTKQASVGEMNSLSCSSGGREQGCAALKKQASGGEVNLLAASPTRGEQGSAAQRNGGGQCLPGHAEGVLSKAAAAGEPGSAGKKSRLSLGGEGGGVRSPGRRGQENKLGSRGVSGGQENSGQKGRSGASRLRLNSGGESAPVSKKLRLTLGNKTLSMMLDEDFV